MLAAARPEKTRDGMTIDIPAPSMKRLLLRLFLRDKLIGQIAAAVASAAAAYGMTYIPGAPDLIKVVLVALLQLPEGTDLTQAGLTAGLTPIILALLNSLVQEFVVRDNNKVLADLKEAGTYEGKIDGWVGPQAKKALDDLIEQSRGLFK